MKFFVVIILISTLVMAVGCEKESNEAVLDGEWRGDITERGKATSVELSLKTQKDGIKGTLTVLDETGEDVDKGMTFEIVEAHYANKELTFIVPISGKIDNDSIEFKLTLEKNSLSGHGKERRESSKKISVTLTKQEKTTE